MEVFYSKVSFPIEYTSLTSSIVLGHTILRVNLVEIFLFAGVNFIKVIINFRMSYSSILHKDIPLSNLIDVVLYYKIDPISSFFYSGVDIIELFL